MEKMKIKKDSAGYLMREWEKEFSERTSIKRPKMPNKMKENIGKFNRDICAGSIDKDAKMEYSKEEAVYSAQYNYFNIMFIKYVFVKLSAIIKGK